MSGETGSARSKFGTLGLDVGLVGRWVRLGYGLFLLVPLTIQSLDTVVSVSEPLTFFGLVLLYFCAIAIAYIALYYVFGESIFAVSNPWLNTLILVGPVVLLLMWNRVFLPATGIVLPGELRVAMMA